MKFELLKGYFPGTLKEFEDGDAGTSQGPRILESGSMNTTETIKRGSWIWIPSLGGFQEFHTTCVV